jgi:hypothetical protein
MSKLWIKFKTNNAVKVSTEECQDVDDFLEACKKKLSSKLGSYDVDQLTLLQPDGTTQIDPGEVIEKLNEFAVGPWNPLVVTVATPAPISSPKKQLTYKGLDVEASCRKYFDALARKLALFYDFKWGPEDDNDYPTFGDVLFAYKNQQWSHRYRKKSYAERTDESGFTQVTSQVPILPVRLPELFDVDEWVKLK